VKEKIAIILVQGADIVPSLRIIVQPLIHLFFVVHISLVDAQLSSQDFVLMDIVTGKGDVPIIILLALFYIQIDIDGIGVESKDRITYNLRIPIPPGIIEVNHALLVVTKVAPDKL